MMAARERNNLVVLFGKRLLFVVIILAIALMGSGVWDVYRKEREARRDKNVAVQELAELRKREVALREKAESLGTQRGLEAALREQFSLAKRGEKLIVIVGRPLPELKTNQNIDLGEWFERLLKW